MQNNIKTDENVLCFYLLGSKIFKIVTETGEITRRNKT